MATSTDSGNEENPTPTSRLSQLSFDGSEEQVAQLLPPGTASVDCASRPDKPNDDENEDLALALILSQLSSEDFDERVAQLDQASAPSDEKVHPITPPNENDDDELELALTLSQLPADIFDQQIGELNRKGEPREAAPASSPSAISLSEVRPQHHPRALVNRRGRMTCGELWTTCSPQDSATTPRDQPCMTIILRLWHWPNKAHLWSNDMNVQAC